MNSTLNFDVGDHVRVCSSEAVWYGIVESCGTNAAVLFPAYATASMLPQKICVDSGTDAAKVAFDEIPVPVQRIMAHFALESLTRSRFNRDEAQAAYDARCRRFLKTATDGAKYVKTAVIQPS